MGKMKTKKSMVLTAILIVMVILGTLPIFASNGGVSATFDDVAAGAWYANAVNYMAGRGIVAGIGAGRFAPELTATRAQFVTIICNAYGIEPLHEGENFADGGNGWYTPYLISAKAKGIAAGRGNNLFYPNASMTRAEMFTFLYNALNVLGRLPVGEGREFDRFSDSEDVSQWAVTAISYLVENGVISGKTDDLLAPNETTTRAEMVMMLYRIIKNEGKTVTPTATPRPRPVITPPVSPMEIEFTILEKTHIRDGHPDHGRWISLARSRSDLLTILEDAYSISPESAPALNEKYNDAYFENHYIIVYSYFRWGYQSIDRILLQGDQLSLYSTQTFPSPPIPWMDSTVMLIEVDNKYLGQVQSLKLHHEIIFLWLL